jgi:hypothetical protein
VLIILRRRMKTPRPSMALFPVIRFGKRRERTYWEITTEPETMPENSTSFTME